MAVSLLQSAYSYLEAASADHSPNLVYCSHDGDTKLHPPCYANDDLAIVDRCIEYSTGQYEQPIWPKRLQKEALERWSECHHRLDTTLWEGLDLQFFFQLFDNFFFCAPGRALKHRVEVQWINHNPESSYCQRKVIASTEKHPRALIKIQKADPSKPFTGETAQRILGNLLHEMGHAFLFCYGRDCNSCRCQVTQSQTVGVTGHGPVWVKLCEAIEAEANRKFQGLPGRWNLDCQENGNSLERERRALKKFEKKPLVRLELDRRAGRTGEGGQMRG